MYIICILYIRKHESQDARPNPWQAPGAEATRARPDPWQAPVPRPPKCLQSLPRCWKCSKHNPWQAPALKWNSKSAQNAQNALECWKGSKLKKCWKCHQEAAMQMVNYQSTDWCRDSSPNKSIHQASRSDRKHAIKPEGANFVEDVLWVHIVVFGHQLKHAQGRLVDPTRRPCLDRVTRDNQCKEHIAIRMR